MNRRKSNANSLLEAPSFRVGSPQFTEVEPTVRSFAVRMLESLAGRELDVLETFTEETGSYYHVVISPKITMPDPDGVTRDYNRAMVTAECTELLHHGFLEAR